MKNLTPTKKPKQNKNKNIIIQAIWDKARAKMLLFANGTRPIRIEAYFKEPNYQHNNDSGSQTVNI